MTEHDYFDPQDFYRENKTPYYRYWNNNHTVYENLFSLYSRTVINPNYPELLLTYGFAPVRASTCFPIVFLYGKEGTGKSTAMNIMCALHGLEKPIAGGGSTFASIRNLINNQRYIDGNPNYQKEGTILLLDNLQSSDLLQDDKLYRLFLTGYDLKTSKMAIAGKKPSEIIYFETFCPKIISSIEPIHQEPSLNELRRRLFVIPFYQINSLDLLRIESIFFEGLNSVYLDFWNRSNCFKFVEMKSKIIKSKKDLKLSDKLAQYFELYLDTLVTGLMIGTWQKLDDGLLFFDNYLSWLNQESNTLDIILSEYIAQCSNPNNIPARWLKLWFKQARDNGILDENISFRFIRQLMFNKGYKLNNEGFIRYGH